MTTVEANLRVRPAEEPDARPLAELWAGAFPGEPRVEVRLRSLLEGLGPHGGLESCWVAEYDGRFVGGFRQYPLTMHLWGAPLPAQGLAAVAVVPEGRRKGIGSRICIEALRLGRARGDALSALFPFRADFYARLGYALVGELHRYRVPTRELAACAAPGEVTPLRGGDRISLPSVFYRSLLGRAHGLVERTEAMWRDRLGGDERVYGVLNGKGVLRGYLITEGARGRSPDRSTLIIRELLAEDEEAYRALLGWIAAQQDQWPNVRYDALPGERFHRYLSHPRTPGSPSARSLWFPSAFLLRGPMLRILDLGRVLEGAGVEGGGRLRVRDAELPENNRDDGNGEPLDIREVIERIVDGVLPGQTGRLREWDPAMGIRDFRLLDVF